MGTVVLLLACLGCYSVPTMYPPEVRERALALHRSGDRIEVIASKTGMSKSLIRILARDAGIARPTGRQQQDVERRFWAKVKVKKGPECWEWQDFLDPFGYGRIWHEGKNVRAHVFSWMLHHGKTTPPKLFVLHRCDNPRCVNPKHLELGDCRKNSLDMWERGRFPLERISGENNVGHKLLWTDVVSIRQRYSAGGISYQTLATEYRVNPSTIRDAIKFITWKELA